MKIYQKISLILSCTIFSFLAFAYLVSESYENDFIAKTEIDLIKEKIQISNAVLESMESTLDDSIKDWAYWDDLYQFVLKPNQNFIQKNINETALINLKLHSLIIGNEQGQALTDFSIDNHGQKIKTDDLFFKLIREHLPDIQNNQSLSDFFVSDQNVFIYHLRKANPSDFSSKDKPMGFVFMAITINEDRLKKVKALTGIHFETNFDQKETFSSFTENSILLNVHFKNKTRTDSFNFGFEIPRRLYSLITSHHKNSMLLIILFLPLAILFSYIFCYLFLKIPFDHFKNHLIKVMDTDSNYLIPHTTRDEFYEIEVVINNLKKMNIESSKTKESERSLRIHKSRLESLGEMAAGIAHEINNPLAIIQGKSQILKKNIAQMSQTEFLTDLDKIILTTNRISKIISGLKTFARIDKNEGLTLHSVNQIIEDTLLLYSAKLKNSNIHFQFDFASDFLINCRPIQIQQVLVNLMNNSIYEIKNLDRPWIHIKIIADSSFVIIQFSDSGNKISQETSEKMMQPFFTTKPIGDGTGLGLSICHSIVKDHGGDFIYNAEAENTTFILKFPKVAPPSKT